MIHPTCINLRCKFAKSCIGAHPEAAGIMQHPATHYKLSESIELQDHMIRIECVDLAAPWQDIEGYLLNLVTNMVKNKSQL
jgi:hypothetical protein